MTHCLAKGGIPMRFNASGTRSFHRSDYYLISERILTTQEFVLFEFLVNQMGFDKNYEDKFGITQIDNYRELARLLGYSSDNSVRNKVGKLVQLGLLTQVGKRRFLVTNHKRYLAQTDKWGGESDIYRAREMGAPPSLILQSIGVNLQLTAEKSQRNAKIDADFPENVVPRYLSSSKVKSSNAGHQQARSLSEYQEIMVSGQFPGLTIDDMQWIDSQKFTEIGATTC